MNHRRRLVDLSEADLEALYARLPEHPIERLQLYHHLLSECREFFARSPAHHPAIANLDAGISALEQIVRRKLC